MGFFVNNIYGGRDPYRVVGIQRDKPADEDSKQHLFDQSQEEGSKKFLKASEKLRKKRSVVVAREIMNQQFIHLEGTLSPEEAWEKIKHHEIKFFPILSEEGKIIGVLSDSQILQGVQEGGKRQLKDLTASETLCADPDTALSEIMHVFSDQTIEAVPVVNEKHEVVGLLTQSDLLQTILKITHLKWNT